MDRIDSLIRELEEAPEGRWELWLRVVRFTCKQGWQDKQRLMINEHLIDQANHLEEEAILIAVAVSLVPAGRIAGVDTEGHAWVMSDDGETIHVNAATPALALASAALKARRGA